jgi:hypothetical protein
MNMRDELLRAEAIAQAKEQDAFEDDLGRRFDEFNNTPERKAQLAEARAQAEAELDEDGLAKAREEVE